MNLHFITSISKEYWFKTAQYCIPSWNLPGKVTVYIDPQDGVDCDWFNDVPFNKRILIVPKLETVNEEYDRNKVFKFWGKSSAQLHAVYNKSDNERIIWLDADIEQIGTAEESKFNFKFDEPIATMYTGDGNDCWETGIVIFNQEYEKLKVVMNRYKEAWNDSKTMSKLWKPYDAQVLGLIAKERGFINLCSKQCNNANAVEHSMYKDVFKHWINKENKKKLRDENS